MQPDFSTLKPTASQPDFSTLKPAQTTPAPQPDFLQKTTSFVNSIFPGGKVGENIGTLAGYIYAKAHDELNGTNNAQYYDLNHPTLGQTLGDIGQGAFTIAAPNLSLIHI